ncbi:stage III sporulation protein AG [Lachnoclostridium phocaeense]|uniref:stage III sporulation protein AG n=1 Tax=Lachnoclostridium phocaeense TaxID=1871021 RepID=UPI00248D3F1F|nr:stage III sporulation protein AG [Lachnoclostridium phocaeense]
MDRNKLKEWWGKMTKGKGGSTWLRKDRLLILLLSGVLLLVITLPISDESGESERSGAAGEQSGGVLPGEEDYAEYMERKLKDVLSKVSGVGEVEVMVTLRSTSEKVVEKDEEKESETMTEQDSQGGTRTTSRNSSSGTTVFGEDGSGTSSGQEPYVTKELTPIVEGVVVIAQGGDEPVTVQNITEAVQALFNVDTHKIKVMKLNEN